MLGSAHLMLGKAHLMLGLVAESERLVLIAGNLCLIERINSLSLAQQKTARNSVLLA